MDNANDVGLRIQKLLEAYTGRQASASREVANGYVNVLDVWQDDGTHFTVTVVKMED